jgi:hypothetical protein
MNKDMDQWPSNEQIDNLVSKGVCPKCRTSMIRNYSMIVI